MHCSYRVCNYMEYCWLCSTWSNQLLSHSIGDGPSWASGFRPPAPGLPAKPKPVHRRVRPEQTRGDSHSLSRFFAVSLALSLWFSWFLTDVNTNTLTTTHGVCVWPLTSGLCVILVDHLRTGLLHLLHGRGSPLWHTGPRCHTVHH